jgi:hypothetical protein
MKVAKIKRSSVEDVVDNIVERSRVELPRLEGAEHVMTMI